MTAEEFWEYCGWVEFGDRKLELVRGEVVETPLTGILHGTICVWVGNLLIEHSLNGGSYNVASNNVLLLLRRHPDTVRGPDLVVFDGNPFREPPETFFSTTPLLLAVEVLGEDDSVEGVNDRVSDLMAYGTPLIWIIDPVNGRITVHSDERAILLEDGDELVGAGRFSGFRHSVQEIMSGPDYRWKHQPS